MKIIEKIKNMDAQFDAPSSKAHTLRGLIIGSLAKGDSVIHKPLLAEDQLNVISCLGQLGVEIEKQDDSLVIHGCGGSYSPDGNELNVGESGVGMNFLTSAACLSDKPVVITGSQRICERPIGEVVDGLRQLGCKIEYLNEEGYPPIRVYGGGLSGGTARIYGAKSSQYFSSIVISSPYAKEDVTLECIDEMTERPYFDISLQMMADFGVRTENAGYKKIHIPAAQRYTGKEFTVEGDYSSASYFFLAAAICQSKITVGGLRQDTKQGDRGFLDLIAKMGAEVTQGVDNIVVTGKPLCAIEVDMSNIPDMVPSVAVACAFAEGVSKLSNIGHLRHKECDRLWVAAEQLQKMGVDARCDDDSLVIVGSKRSYGAEIDPYNDHRIAMSFATAGLVTGDQRIKNPCCVGKSFPDFWEKFEIFARI